MWCSFQRNVSNTLQNWDTQRRYSARLDAQIQGFTEEWENSDSTLDDIPIGTGITGPQHPDCNVRIFQYRPAWLEQLVLRISKIPHIVINSPYAVTEVTGPLPMLQDFDGGSLSRETKHAPPAMVGRNQIVGESTIHNSILDYLKLHRGVDLDSILVSEQQIQQSATFVAIIRDTLDPCLMALRYKADPAAWDQIYRSQCISATSGSSNNWACKPILAMWQAWSEKVHHTSNLSLIQLRQTKESNMDMARRTYAIFEHQLKLHQSDSKQYILGTDKPTLVDCIFWDHVMQALTDIHLVILLAEFPMILKFTQNIWEQFSFGTIVEDVDIRGASVWVWNMEENAMNAFARVPLVPDAQLIETDAAYRTAGDFMNKLNMLQNDLGKSLALAKQQRSAMSYLTHRDQPFAAWHRWRIGGGFLPKKGPENDTGAPEESSRREYQRNDEIWMIGVTFTTIVAMVGFGLVS